MGISGELAFGRRIRRFREALGLTQEGLAAAAGLDRSYVGGIERGERNPSLTAILHLAEALGIQPARLFAEVDEEVIADVSASSGVTTTETSDGLSVGFRYDNYDAKYVVIEATQSQFDDVIGTLRNELATGGSRSDAVSRTFINAVQTWPNTNPSDLWTFVLNRAYCDRSNHPPANSRLNLEQSWKRTSGWALERVLVEHYGEFLQQHGLTIKISNKAEKTALLGVIRDPRIVPDKADVLLTYDNEGKEDLLGVIHVKASVAERRTDDVPMSQALIQAGYLSIFWTMDVKSFPSPNPVNRGEFGSADSEDMSDKRRDIEEHGHFSACFSYNQNTQPTPDDSGARARIFVCDFTNPDDHFAQFLIDALHQRMLEA